MSTKQEIEGTLENFRLKIYGTEFSTVSKLFIFTLIFEVM